MKATFYLENLFPLMVKVLGIQCGTGSEETQKSIIFLFLELLKMLQKNTIN